jgi:hypothetical protein
VLNLEPVSPRLLNPTVPHDLETICLKCLSKEPDRRYPTAQALGEDLSRFLNAESILARPTTILEGTWRWCRRKPAFAGLLAAAVVLRDPRHWIAHRCVSHPTHSSAEANLRRRSEHGTAALADADLVHA